MEFQMRKLSVGDLVVFNHTLDAAFFRVVHIDGFMVGVKDRSMEDMANAAIQMVDKSMILRPSIGQLKTLN
jgi:ASC-1-like (ASCH) protein